MEEAAAEAKKAEGASCKALRPPVLLEEQLESIEIMHSTYYILIHEFQAGRFAK